MFSHAICSHAIFFSIAFLGKLKSFDFVRFCAANSAFSNFHIFQEKKKIVVEYGEKIKSPFFTHKIVKKMFLPLNSKFSYFFHFCPCSHKTLNFLKIFSFFFLRFLELKSKSDFFLHFLPQFFTKKTDFLCESEQKWKKISFCSNDVFFPLPPGNQGGFTMRHLVHP